MKNKNKKIEVISINVTNKKDKSIMERAMEILDKAGYTICKKNSFVLSPETE